jgi:HEAT repeat protein/energy-coupling factor transporter ATP-binding protein EcfA2/transcriptional regulator with XRE-family HTH domain
MSEKRKRGFSIQPEGLALIQNKMAEKGYNRQKLADAADYLSIDTVNRLFRGHTPERKTIEAIANALDLKPTDLVAQSEWFPTSSTAELEKTAASEINIDWRDVCRAMLEKQQESQKLRRKATEMGFEVNVHVPLGLVERKQQQRRDGNIELDRLYQLDGEVIAKTYQHEEFLTEVIGQSQARKNKHIAIVGEPGAGKTTLLGAIASFIQSNTEDLPICIALASLQGRTLEDYLLKTWLPEAMGLVNPEVALTPEIENELIKEFRKGGVWLLLDGVDEIGADSPVQALAIIQKQLTGWLGQGRVVLTCRLNVWDASVNNTLTGFDTYRSQELTHEQIDQFIQEWFTCAKDAQRGEQLQAKLKETRRERIRELVKNPLRLALLCQTFYLDKQGDLPETKAALYGRFTRYFYEWKQNLHPKDLINQDELKDELHQALGKLALAGINSKARFRLRQSLARQEMGEPLFKLACDLGWLNLVDREAKTDEAVYAFFHANFQEYFAALAVDDWHYFLNPVSHNPAQGNYRIFEPQWKEVILLWLGQGDVEKEQKEALIETLVEFEDGCGDENFYRIRGYFIAAAGVAEFRDCRLTDAIVVQIVKWGFGYVDVKKQQKRLNYQPSRRTAKGFGNVDAKEPQKFIYPIANGARAVLQETNPSKAIVNLTKLLDSSQDEEIRCEAACILGQFDPSNSKAISVLRELKRTTKYFPFLFEADQMLEQMGAGKSELITYWLNQLHRSKKIGDRAALRLEQLDRSNSDHKAYIQELLRSSDEQLPLGQAVMHLRIIGAGNAEAIAALQELLHTSQSKHFRKEAALSLGEIDPGNPETVTTLMDLLHSSQDENTRLEAALALRQIGADNSESVTTLRELLHTAQDERIRRASAVQLGEIDPGNSEAISALLDLLHTSQDEYTREQVVEGLGEIGAGNGEVIAALRDLLYTNQDEGIRQKAAESLGQIDPGNPEAISALLDLLHTCEDECIRKDAADSLQKIDPGNPEAVAALVELLRTRHLHCNIWEEAGWSLEEISDRHLLSEIVKGLKDCLQKQVKKYDFERYKACQTVLWHCAENMTYPDFYQSWHGEPSSIQPLEDQFADIASQLQPTQKTYPILINAQALEGETDTSAIAQELCNQINLNAFPDAPEIPEVSNAPQLKRLIPQIKKRLQKQNLALILDKCEPNQAQITFCRKLTDVLHIAWITNQSLEAPLKGLLPHQPNLLSAIQSWLNEIG